MRLSNSRKALSNVQKLLVAGVKDADGMGEMMKYWDFYRNNICAQRKANVSAPDSIDSPMAIKNAALLLAGDIQLQNTEDDMLPPIFTVEQDDRYMEI